MSTLYFKGFLYYQQGGKAGTEKVREGSCDEGGKLFRFMIESEDKNKDGELIK